jgi:hypothetical protein
LSEEIPTPDKYRFDVKLTGDGATVISHFSPEDKEKLIALKSSSAWKLYRQILAAHRDGQSQAVTLMLDTNKVFRTLGEVAGLHLAVTQLDRLVEQFEKAKRVAADSKKQTEPVR